MALQDELRELRVRPAPVPGSRRRDRVAAWIVILGPLLGIAIWLGLRQQVGDLEERLVRDANATFSRPLLRPVHVDVPTPGTFGDAVARHLPPIQRWADSAKVDAKARETARDVVAGKRPLSELTPAYAAALRSLAPSIDGLLAGTRAASAELPSRKDAWNVCDGADWLGYQAAALLAGLRMREALASGDEARATELCLDGLGLGRDAAISTGLVGHMVGVAIVKRLWPPCVDAVVGLPAEERPGVTARLRAARDAFPSVAGMFRVEFLVQELMGMGGLMSEEARSRLSPKAAAQRASAQPLPTWERLAARDGWRATRAVWDKLIRVAELNRGLGRDAGFAAVELEAERGINPFVELGKPGRSPKYARRAESAVARLDLLVLSAAAFAFLEAEGRWPASVAELTARGLLSPQEEERLAEARFRRPDTGGAFEARLSVFTGDEEKPTEELVLEVRPPARGRRR